MDDLISRQKALDHLRKRLIQTANNNVGFVCDAGSTFQDASERVKTWLDEVPSAQPELLTVNIDNELTKDECDRLKQVMMDSPILLLPSAQRTGRWIWDDEGYHCTECFYHAYNATGEIMTGEYKFCPNCGARMEVQE